MKTTIYFGLVAAFLAASFRVPAQVVPAEAMAESGQGMLRTIESGGDMLGSLGSFLRDAAPVDLPEVLTGEKEFFRAVEDAILQSDPLGCGELKVSSEGGENAPSRGDWIAYCLARVTKNALRCDQITPGISPDLRLLCREES